MRNLFFYIIFITNCLNIEELIPNIIVRNQHIKPKNEKFYKVNVNQLMPNNYYKIMIHYLGPVLDI